MEWRTPLILNLALDEVNDQLPPGERAWYPMNRSLGEPTAVVGVLGKTKSVAPVGIGYLRILGIRARCPVIIPTELSRFSRLLSMM